MSEALRELTEGVFVDRGSVTILGMPLTTTMTVLRIRGRELLVHSPLPATEQRRAELDALGTVAHLYAPNTYHHMWIGEWATAYPHARLHAPAGLAAKRPDLRIDRVHASGEEPGFAGFVEELPIHGFRLEETVLLHLPSRTLVVADLVHAIGRPPGWWTGVYTRLMGFWDRVALSRMIRVAGFSDRTAARRSIDVVLEREFERMVVGHGEVVDSGAREALAAAFAWLPPVK
jgi:hypothetical protein